MNPLSVQLARILVIDDDAMMRGVLCALLEAEGCVVEAAASGEAGVAKLRGGFPAEVVLTDLQLPGVAGAALAARLRAVAPGARLMAMSGSEPAAEDRAAFDAFLLKPFSIDDFAAAALALPLPAETAAPKGGRPDAAPLDERTYRRLSSAMPAAQLAELYRLTQDDIAGRLATMREALGAEDKSLYRREAHALKGGCSMVGAVELASLATRAEECSLADTPALLEFSAAAERLRSIIAARFLVH